MPSLTLHLYLAETILEEWEAGAPGPSFPRDDALCRNAFLQGSLGPDLGYFPGGERILSDYAHCLRTGALARNLLGGARTPRERAFALGWLTHVLADRLIHPIIGSGVGELIHGERSRRVDACRDEASHVRVETGLDAHFSVRFPRLRERTLAPFFDEATVVFLTAAYQRTYGVEPDPRVVLRSHRRATRLTAMGLRIIGFLGERARRRRSSASAGGGSGRLVPRAFASWGSNAASPSVVWAFLTPVEPASWLLEEVRDAMQRIPRLFHRQRTTELAELDDYNLDSGRLEADHIDHPVTRRLLESISPRGEVPSRSDGNPTSPRDELALIPGA